MRGKSEAQSNAEAIANRDRTYTTAHETSVRIVANRPQPKGLERLTRWFFGEWRDELPDEIHKHEEWRDYVVAGESAAGKVDGLGAPAYADDFRRYLENSPFETDPDGRYVRPVHAAMARMAGRGGFTGPTEKLAAAPFMARFLFRLATSADLTFAAASLGIPPQVTQVYAEQALFRLWSVYDSGPGVLRGAAA